MKKTGTSMTTEKIKVPKNSWKSKGQYYCVKCRKYTKEGEKVRYTPRRLIQHVKCPQ